MTIRAPSDEEARSLLVSPVAFRGYSICDGALPPSRVLEGALASEDRAWCMPRLFCVDDTPQVVGSAGFKCMPRERRVEIGYNVSPVCMRRGYGTEGVRLLVREAFASGLVDEVFAEVAITNHASQRVLKEIGFTIYGTRAGKEGPTEFWALKKEPNQAPEPTTMAVTPRAPFPTSK